jgi:hypothetical protein
MPISAAAAAQHLRRCVALRLEAQAAREPVAALI